MIHFKRLLSFSQFTEQCLSAFGSGLASIDPRYPSRYQFMTPERVRVAYETTPGTANTGLFVFTLRGSDYYCLTAHKAADKIRPHGLA